MTPTNYDDGSGAAAASREAAESIAPRRATMRARVLYAIRDAEPRGATDEELQGLLYMNPSTERPRRIELREAGWVEEGGWGTTRAGRKAIRWRLTEHARKGFGLPEEEKRGEVQRSILRRLRKANDAMSETRETGKEA